MLKKGDLTVSQNPWEVREKLLFTSIIYSVVSLMISGFLCQEFTDHLIFCIISLRGSLKLTTYSFYMIN